MPFELDKAGIKRAFSAAALSYDPAADLQRETGQSLLTHLLPAAGDRNAGGRLLLDLGCGTGFLTLSLFARNAVRPDDTLIALDLAAPMLRQMRQRLPNRAGVHYLCADAEQLPLPDNTVDCVFSNLALQWCRTSTSLFAGIRRILKPGGRLVFSTFGPDTLHELKQSWAAVDRNRHVNEFDSAATLQRCLEQAGFGDIQVIARYSRRHYPSAPALMRELKALGAHNGARDRPRALTGKTALRRLAAAYDLFRSGDGLLPATFEILLVAARA